MFLEISRPLRASDQFRRDTITRACLVGIALTVVSGVAVVVLGMALIGRPLNRLVEKTRRVGTGDLAGPVVWKRHDEMGELARALNEMCEHLAEVRAHLLAETEARVRAVQQLRHADRLTTVGRLAAGMAHEVGTPLNVASARADMICEETVQSNEDDSEMRSVIALHLRREGYEVTECRDGMELLDHLNGYVEHVGGAEEFDLIVSDIRMPGVFGLSVAAETS